MGVHALHAPSAAHRWLVCPGSIPRTVAAAQRAELLGERFDTGSPAAREGTFAHLVAYAALISNRPASSFVGLTSKDREAFLKAGVSPRKLADDLDELDAYPEVFTVDEQMVEGVQEYISAIAQYDAEVIFYESRVSLAGLGVPEVSGTFDCALRDSKGVWHVFDFKYGWWLVDVDDNPQQMIYAAPCVATPSPLASGEVVLHVVQPKRGGHRQWSTTREYLIEWVQTTLNEGVARTRAPNPPLCAGSHCRFCPVRTGCPEIQRASVEAAREIFDDVENLVPAKTPPPLDLMPPAMLARVLSAVPLIEQWLTDVRSHAYRRASAGQTIPGFKLVEKVGNRKWRDEDLARDTLEVYFPDPSKMLVPPPPPAPPALKSPSQIEKALGAAGTRAVAKLLAALTEKPSRGTVLVPDTDPAPAVNAASVFDDGFFPTTDQPDQPEKLTNG